MLFANTLKYVSLFSAVSLPSTLLLSDTAYAYQYGNNTVPVKHDPSEIPPDVFSDPEYPIYSPAFINGYHDPPKFASGLAPPTSEHSLESFLLHFVESHQKNSNRLNSFASYHELSQKSEEGRPLRFLVLSKNPCVKEKLDPGVVDKNFVESNIQNQQHQQQHQLPLEMPKNKQPWSNQVQVPFCSDSIDTDSQRLRVWIQGGAHGNEPAGGEAVLALIGKLSNDTNYANYLLEKMDIVFLPRFNPDGNHYFQRPFASNVDPNRDHLRLASTQSKAIKNLYNHFNPHIAIDMHEFTGSKRPRNDFVPAEDALFAAAKNLNIDPNIRNISETIFVDAIHRNLDKNGFRGIPYFTQGRNPDPTRLLLNEAGSDARIGRNQYGLTQTISFLTETRGIGLADEHFKRRTATGLTMVTAILDTACENAARVYDVVEEARMRLLKRDELRILHNYDDEIVVTDKTQLKKVSYQLIDASNGTLYETSVDWASTTPTIPSLTRPRPKAYLIPPAWEKVANHLQDLGVKVDRLDHEFQGVVETLKIESSKISSKNYEGYFPHTVTTSLHMREISLPPGSFYVSTNQPNAAIAYVTLEPESVDSYVTNSMIPVMTGDEYYIFRIPRD